jgi:hypothetical protein
MGSGEKDKRRAGYDESGERWVERSEAKVFANRERYKNFIITQPLRRAYGKLFTFSGNYQDALRMYTGSVAISLLQSTGTGYHKCPRFQRVSDHHNQTKPGNYCPSHRYSVCVCTWLIIGRYFRHGLFGRYHG